MEEEERDSDLPEPLSRGTGGARKKVAEAPKNGHKKSGYRRNKSKKRVNLSHSADYPRELTASSRLSDNISGSYPTQFLKEKVQGPPSVSSDSSDEFKVPRSHSRHSSGDVPEFAHGFDARHNPAADRCHDDPSDGSEDLTEAALKFPPEEMVLPHCYPEELPASLAAKFRRGGEGSHLTFPWLESPAVPDARESSRILSDAADDWDTTSQGSDTFEPSARHEEVDTDRYESYRRQRFKRKWRERKNCRFQTETAVIADKDATRIHDIPEEVMITILSMLDPFDLWSVGKTCRFFYNITNSELLWKYQWQKLQTKTPFRFPSTQKLQNLGVSFKDSCRRLCATICRNGNSFPKCRNCKEFTCDLECLETFTSKIVLDIGGEMTWLITADFGFRGHLSMMAVPKLLCCYDCDAIIDRGKSVCDCIPEGSDSSSTTRFWPPITACRYQSFSSHTGLQYCSQQLKLVEHEQGYNQPLCLFCEEDKVQKLLCECNMVLRTKAKLAGYGTPYNTEDIGKPAHSTLSNGYCRDYSAVYGAENMDLLSPLLALEHKEAFPLVKAFLSHLFKSLKMLDDLQQPNSCLVFTEPPNFPLAVKEKLMCYLFEEVQIARLCFLPKALAISLLFEVNTCIVIDSGATNTSVWVVLDGRVDTKRTRCISVGGWHVSEFLKQALAWKDGPEVPGATVASIDDSDVKRKCRLSLNLSREEQLHQQSPNKTETLHIRIKRGEGRAMRGAVHGFWGGGVRQETAEVTLSSELYLAPEMMYASLDLPKMVLEATRDLPQHFVKDCFSNILITGGNTDLQGFIPRLSCDLREMLPDYAGIINIRTDLSGNHSYNTALGANKVEVPPPYDAVLQLHTPGTPYWISREKYVLLGSHQLTNLEDEGGAEMG